MKNFEKNMQDLNNIVEKLEGGELSLNDAMNFYKQGVELSAKLHKELEAAEGQIKIIEEGKEPDDFQGGI